MIFGVVFYQTLDIRLSQVCKAAKRPMIEIKKDPFHGFVNAVTFILVFFLLSRTPQDADLWWHLRAGEVMWEQKSILLSDPFSYTRLGVPWINAFWATETLLYLLFRIGGYFALAAFVSLTGAFTFHVIQRRLMGDPFINGFIIILAALTAAPTWGPRPQIISFLLVAFLDYWVSKNRQRRYSRWVIVPLFVLWANLHGGWIWGFLLLIAHAAGMLTTLLLEHSQEQKAAIWNETRSLMGWLVLAALAVGINPNGPAIWKLPFEQVNVSMQIQEWLSPDFHRVDFHPMLWMIFLLILTAPFSVRPPNWSQLFKVIGFAYLTFVAQRNIALFAIVAAPLLSDWLNSVKQDFWKEKRLIPRPSLSPHLTAVLNPSILFLLSVAAAGNLFLASQPVRVDRNYPAGAIEWMKENRPLGRLFNSYNWGGYILWKLPEYPVFIDGRADMYGTEVISQWQDVVHARGNAFEILDTWNVNIVLLEPGWPIVKLLINDGWKTAYQDEQSIILLLK